jgi:cation transport ATPase
MTGGSLYAVFKLYDTIKKKKITKWWGERHKGHEALQEARAGTRKLNPKEKGQTIQQGLLISSLSLGLATTGSLFYAPLSIVSIAPLLYLGMQAALDAAKSLWHEKRPNTALLDTVIFALCIFQSYYIAISLVFWFDYLSQKSIYQGLEQSGRTLSNQVGKPESLTWVLNEGAFVEVPTKSLQADEIVVVHAGELVPVDGVTTDGHALVNEYLLTATSQAIIKKSGDQVFAGAMVLAGRICVKVERAGEATHQAQMAEILTRANSPNEKLTQQLALPLLCLGSMASFVLEPMGVLGIMATRLGYDRVAPLGRATYLERTLQHGILIRDGRALQWLSQIESVVIQYDVAKEASSTISLLREQHVKSIYPFESTQELQKVLDSLQIEGKSVCYIGYEVPDAMQSVAKVCISVGCISDITSDSAQIVLLDGTLNQLCTLFELAKSYDATYKKSFMMSGLPAILALSAPFLFHTGLITTIVLNQIGLLIGVAQYRQS